MSKTGKPNEVAGYRSPPQQGMPEQAAWQPVAACHRHRLAAVFACCLFTSPCGGWEASRRAVAQDLPVVHDPRLQLTQLAATPQIVTPIGLAVGNDDRLYVLESHTHDRPPGYQGPKADRVKVIADRDGDGDFEDVHVFAEGIQQGLQLAFSPDNVLYVVCARQVLALPDLDQDGRCDGPQTVLTMQTAERYSHNCLLGITFGPDRWLYLSRGNTASRAYTLLGTDGSRVEGYGDGGNIVRCRPDGSQLELFATGFWNPFGIKFDHAGRLLCVDNDPDARGPNRLVHVVPGGDYGYRSIYGGGGNHPFQAWNGELPGTLPYISGTGEAPCDLLDGRATNFPSDLSGGVLVTVWNENTIERHVTTPQGTSLKARRTVLVSGGDDFRPVALAADKGGNVYFTDWVAVAYPNHGRGRLWRMSVVADPPTHSIAPAADSERDGRLRTSKSARDRLATADDAGGIRASLGSDDPFRRHVAVMALAQPSQASLRRALAEDPIAELRLGALLAFQRSPLADQEASSLIRRFLRDEDERLRHAALIWAGTARITAVRPALDRAIEADEISARLFAAYLAAVECTDADYAKEVRQRAQSKSKDIASRLPDGVTERVVTDRSRSAEVRSLAVMRLRDEPVPPLRSTLLEYVRGAEEPLQRATMRRLSGNPSEEVRNTFRSVAFDRDRNAAVRAEALLALSRDPELEPETLLPLLTDDPPVAMEAARTLRQFPPTEVLVSAVERRLEAIRHDTTQAALTRQLRFYLEPTQHDRPETLEQWQQALSAGGDAAAGRRVFYSVQASCSNCHTTSGLGGTLGPDLSNLAQSVDRGQIIRSILRPSEQFPPQYQAWTVLTTDGRVYQGLQLDHKREGAIELYTTEGITRHFSADEVEDYQASSQSLMPSGLEAKLTVDELLDLVAYLEAS